MRVAPASAGRYGARVFRRGELPSTRMRSVSHCWRSSCSASLPPRAPSPRTPRRRTTPAERGRCSRRLDPSGRLDRPHHHHRAGESIVRSLLRDVPRRERDPDATRRDAEDLHPGRVLGHCSRPYHSTTQYPAGRTARSEGIAHRREPRQDERLRDIGDQGQGQVRHRAYRFTAACRSFLGPKKQPDVLSYHTGKEIPNYWAYARHYVLQDRMFAPADSWTLPSHLFLFSGWSALLPRHERPDELPLEHRPARAGIEQYRYTASRPIYAWTDITYLLGKAGVSWKVYMGKGTCVQDPCTQKPGRYGKTLRPRARSRASSTSCEHGQLGQLHHARGVHPPGRRRARCRRCPGSCRATSRASTRDRARRSGAGRPTSRGSSTP